MATAHTVYANQTRGNAFTSVLAWKRVRDAPKWRPDQDDLTTPIPSDISTPVPSSDQTDNGHPPSTPTVIGICTPSSRSASSIMRPMGQKAAKKRRLEGTNDNELSAQAAELTQLSRDRVAAMITGNEIMREKNEISKERLKIEEKKFNLEEKKIQYDENHRMSEKSRRESETQMNELKMLRESFVDLEDDETREVLKLMKKNIKRKWLSN
jgi:hypothetical protein